MRINTTEIKMLADQHAYSEFREIGMLPSYIRRSVNSKNFDYKSSTRYTLNTGHGKFFYDKLGYVKWRLALLRKELIYFRGYDEDKIDAAYKKKVNDINDAILVLKSSGVNQIKWQPDETDISISKSRINSRLREKINFYTYYGIPVVDMPILFKYYEGNE